MCTYKNVNESRREDTGGRGGGGNGWVSRVKHMYENVKMKSIISMKTENMLSSMLNCTSIWFTHCILRLCLMHPANYISKNIKQKTPLS